PCSIRRTAIWATTWTRSTCSSTAGRGGCACPGTGPNCPTPRPWRPTTVRIAGSGWTRCARPWTPSAPTPTSPTWSPTSIGTSTRRCGVRPGGRSRCSCGICASGAEQARTGPGPRPDDKPTRAGHSPGSECPALVGCGAERVSGLAGAAGQPLGVDDQHRLALQAQPAALREVGQRLVHGLAGGADQLGDLLLRQVVGDPQGAGLLGAEALRELQQRLGHPARDV